MKEFMIEEFVSTDLKNIGHSGTQLKRTPLGEKIIITASRPGFVVGRKGENIKAMTEKLKKKFDMENPQIEINDVENVNLDANVVAERIASTLERFGTTRFKGVGHRVLADVMGSGAIGVEILMTGKIPGARAKRWRFYQGYLKKCGDIAIDGVRKAIVTARLKTGVIGIQVRIMPPELKLPDNITLNEETETVEEEITEGTSDDSSEDTGKETEEGEEQTSAAAEAGNSGDEEDKDEG